MTQKILVGLPAYNESKGIAKLLDRLNHVKNNFYKDFKILVVNDGSSDDTEKYLKDYAQKFSHISYINHPYNQGLAQGMRTLINYAVNNLKDDDLLVVLDADNTHNPKIIPDMVKTLVKKDLDIIIASRFEKGGEEKGLSTFRKILSRGASLFCKLVFPVKNVKDFSCGYRAYRVGFLKKMANYYKENLIEAQGFECMIEIIAKAGILGAKVEEYPLILEYNLKETPSKMKVVQTILGYFKLGFKINIQRMRVYK